MTAYSMLGVFLCLLLLFLVLCIYWMRTQEGFIGLTDSIPMEPMKEFIQHDLDSLNGKRLLYILYATVGTSNTLIDKKIKELKLDSEYTIVRVFPVSNTVVATSLFSHFYQHQMVYDEITILTNNIATIKKDNTQLITFVNTDTPWYREVVNIITKYNVVV
jgi:hypothetical protein